MKTLLYTVSDFKNGSLECIDMLLSCIQDSEYDFAIISNAKLDCKYKVYSDPNVQNYIGFLKYSKVIPSGYDQYIYFDSDILYFGKLIDLFDSREFSITQESMMMDQKCTSNSHWFKYEYDNTTKYLEKISKIKGINAGSFCFKNLNFLSKVRSKFENYISESDVLFNARLEQSSFNYAICEELDFDISQAYNFTNTTVLHAHNYEFSNDKKLYHFCGFSNEMNSKLYKMKNFYDKYKR